MAKPKNEDQGNTSFWETCSPEIADKYSEPYQGHPDSLCIHGVKLKDICATCEQDYDSSFCAYVPATVNP